MSDRVGGVGGNGCFFTTHQIDFHSAGSNIVVGLPWRSRIERLDELQQLRHLLARIEFLAGSKRPHSGEQLIQHDAEMLQLGKLLRFLTVLSDLCGRHPFGNLDRDATLQFVIHRQIDRTETTLSKTALDAVSANRLNRISHYRSVALGSGCYRWLPIRKKRRSLIGGDIADFQPLLPRRFHLRRFGRGPRFSPNSENYAVAVCSFGIRYWTVLAIVLRKP
jgi:hypothetical protein